MVWRNVVLRPEGSESAVHWRTLLSALIGIDLWAACMSWLVGIQVCTCQTGASLPAYLLVQQSCIHTSYMQMHVGIEGGRLVGHSSHGSSCIQQHHQADARYIIPSRCKLMVPLIWIQWAQGANAGTISDTTNSNPGIEARSWRNNRWKHMDGTGDLTAASSQPCCCGHYSLTHGMIQRLQWTAGVRSRPQSGKQWAQEESFEGSSSLSLQHVLAGRTPATTPRPPLSDSPGY